MYGYQDRYRAIPGDDKGATPLGRRARGHPGQRQRRRGRRIQRRAAATDESRLFWDHLRRAGFVGGHGHREPLQRRLRQDRRADRRRQRRPPPGVLGQSAGGHGTFTGLILCTANLPDKIAISVDTQMDDGQRQRRHACARLKGRGEPSHRAPALRTTYTEDGVSTYVLCRQM